MLVSDPGYLLHCFGKYRYLDGDDVMQLLCKDLSPVEADVVKGYLEDHGIPCFLEDKGLTETMPHLQIAFGGAKVFVGEQDLDRARQLLANLPDPEDDGPDDLELESPDERTVVLDSAKLESKALLSMRLGVLGMFSLGITNLLGFPDAVRLLTHYDQLSKQARRHLMIAWLSNLVIGATLVALFAGAR